MSTDIRLICFDLGRVLVRICDGWKQACARVGVPARAEPDESARAAIHQLVCDHEVGKIDHDEYCRRMAVPLQIEPKQVEAMMNGWLIEPYPGIDRMIDDLHAAGYQTACLSNTNANHWRILLDRGQPAGLPLDKLTYRFASQLVGHRKPDEGIYKHVEQVTGLAGPQIVFFDDVPENIDTAKQRGWIAERILHDNDPMAQVRTHLTRLGVLPGRQG